jgi:hypothetical protein
MTQSHAVAIRTRYAGHTLPALTGRKQLLDSHSVERYCCSFYDI